jgi:uncharacterized protein (DUF4415 family)
MAKRRVNPEATDADNPEWTKRDFARARPAADVLSPRLLRKLRGPHQVRVRGPQKAPTKERITIRLSRDVVSRFRESGTGWHGKIDEALRTWLRHHSP